MLELKEAWLMVNVHLCEAQRVLCVLLGGGVASRLWKPLRIYPFRVKVGEPPWAVNCLHLITSFECFECAVLRLEDWQDFFCVAVLRLLSRDTNFPNEHIRNHTQDGLRAEMNVT